MLNHLMVPTNYLPTYFPSMRKLSKWFLCRVQVIIDPNGPIYNILWKLQDISM